MISDEKHSSSDAQSAFVITSDVAWVYLLYCVVALMACLVSMLYVGNPAWPVLIPGLAIVFGCWFSFFSLVLYVMRARNSILTKSRADAPLGVFFKYGVSIMLLFPPVCVMIILPLGFLGIL